jgi:hypothetical protein
MPAGAYTLWVDDKDLGPYAILADLPVAEAGAARRLRLTDAR